MHLSLNKHEVKIGEAITLRHWLKFEEPAQVLSVGYLVRRVGFVHRKLGRMVYLDDSPSSRIIDNGEVLEKVPQWISGSHGVLLKKLSNGERGIEVTTRPRSAGIFLLQVEWTVRSDAGQGRDAALRKSRSEAVMLVVQPGPDGKAWPIGQPVGSDNADDLEEAYEVERSEWADTPDQGAECAP